MLLLLLQAQTVPQSAGEQQCASTGVAVRWWRWSGDEVILHIACAHPALCERGGVRRERRPVPGRHGHGGRRAPVGCGEGEITVHETLRAHAIDASFEEDELAEDKDGEDDVNEDAHGRPGVVGLWRRRRRGRSGRCRARGRFGKMGGRDRPYRDGGGKKIDVDDEENEGDEADAKVDGALAILQERDQGGLFAGMGGRGVVTLFKIGRSDEGRSGRRSGIRAVVVRRRGRPGYRERVAICGVTGREGLDGFGL